MSCAVCPHIDERSRNPILVHTTQYIYIRVRLYNIKYILHQLYCIRYDILYSVNMSKRVQHRLQLTPDIEFKTQPYLCCESAVRVLRSGELRALWVALTHVRLFFVALWALALNGSRMPRRSVRELYHYQWSRARELCCALYVCARARTEHGAESALLGIP